MSQQERVVFLNDRVVPRADRVVYWMQASVRSRFNHALEYAIHLAHHRSQPLDVVFGLTPGYPGAEWRHYHFLLEGLVACAASLRDRGITFRVLLGDPADIALAAGRTATTIVTDRGYARVQREWRERVAREAVCPVVQVESNVVVPAELVSTREEWSAATFRRRIAPHRDRFLQPLRALQYRNGPAPVLPPQTGLDDAGVDPEALLADRARMLDALGLSDAVPPSEEFHGGEDQAAAHLDRFVESALIGYGERRNDPELDATSHLSPYLHYGHISPVEIALRAVDAASESWVPQHDLEAFLEELIVRREVAVNFVLQNAQYDSFAALPAWARTTLNEHSGDERPAIYDYAQLEEGATEDPYWNAAQREMRRRGRMHNYMRMYWGKRILEWHQDPQEAFDVALRLNDRWELDGRDPGGYAGVAWCFGKHDRPWVERPVFGKVRYMNANGLRRKFKTIERYVDRWNGRVRLSSESQTNS